jgi:uncharacterized protein (DUF362 family)
MSSIDRRDFIGAVAAAGAGAALVGRSRRALAQGENGKSRIVRCRRDNAIDDNDQLDEAVVKQMVDATVAKLVGADSAEAGWKALFDPDDVVTIKVNCLFGVGACTHPAVADIVAAGLLTAGVLADNITIWDRSVGDLQKCGYTIQEGPGVKVMASKWEPNATQHGSINGKLADILTRPENTALVNVPILKTHSMPGITLAMKNHYGSFDNPNKAHANGCDPYLADINDIPAIRDKTRLIVVDALRPVGEGGPKATPEHTWNYGAIMAAQDPVACDTVGVQIIDEWRATKGMPPIAPKARFLQTAADKGLGTNDPAKIELVDV